MQSSSWQVIPAEQSSASVHSHACEKTKKGNKIKTDALKNLFIF